MNNNELLNENAWRFGDLAQVPPNGFTVMSTFACGGGSSMGYKRAGFDVIAACEIDEKVANHYKINSNPRYFFLCPIKKLMNEDLPQELFNLDILDGSPPCSTFSMAGKREQDWGKVRKFKEGQHEQMLSELFFDFIDLANYLKPEVIVGENVTGLLAGNGKGYVKKIMHDLREIGYTPQLFVINSAGCGVPQNRRRVFFCAVQSHYKLPPLILVPEHRHVTVGEALSDLQVLTDDEIVETRPSKSDLKYWPLTKQGGSYAEAANGSFFNHRRLHRNRPAPTLTANHAAFMHYSENRKLTFREYKRLSSFPVDYYATNPSIGKYMVGMSVPPKMTEFIAREICNQWLKNI